MVSFWGCAPVLKGAPERESLHAVTEISGGLPTEGLWREGVALIDMDGDGFLDIIAPPPRKGGEGRNRPYIFMRGKDGTWREGKYDFPEVKYGYGGIAAGDLNGDGYPDIVIAVHSGEIILLENNKGGGFVSSTLSAKEKFHSRAVELADVNGDGWLDIVALSESGFATDYMPKGILIGINRGGKGWDAQILEESNTVQGDSLSLGNISGDGKKDIAAAQLAVRQGKKIIWFGDGKGNFKNYEKDVAEETMPMIVRTGDLDGDGRDEVVLKVSTVGAGAVLKFSVLKWTGDGFNELSSGLEKEQPIAFDLADLDGDGRKELVVLSEKAISIYKYIEGRWVERGHYSVSPEDSKGARDLRVGRNKDGSFLIVHNMGGEFPDSLHHGIKAYTLRSK